MLLTIRFDLCDTFTGSGDRKQVVIPTEVRIRPGSQSESSKTAPISPDVEEPASNTKALVACGGDFTIYIDDDGRIYATGNMSMRVWLKNILKYILMTPLN